ncbi:MAG TPA: DUF3108 domain-containing protein [Terriglobales bacterium]|nr:DUF3108 domain-containing protein [Terriglobales bacterium]
MAGGRKFAVAQLLLLLACTFSRAQIAPPAQKNVPAASVSAAPGARIIPPPPNYQFPNGQTYVYGVEWHLFNAGIATVKMEAAGAEKKVTAIANSIGAVNVLYSVHDQFESRFSPQTFCSLRVVKHTEEGSRKRDTQIRFDYSRGKAVLDEKNLKTGETKHVENDVPACITDVVTGFYYLASLPLQTGNSYTFSINDGGKTAEVQARVEGRERVKTPAGSFAAVRVAVEPISGPLKGKGKVWVWYSDDGNHVPVQMRSKLGWGTLLFRLQRWEKP